MKLPRMARLISYAVAIAFALSGLPHPSSLASNTHLATRSQGGESTIYLPIVMTSLPPIIPNTTNVLTSATTQYLASISNDAVVFTFTQMTSELANVSPGEVITGAPSAPAPYGFLRKVSAISTSAGNVIVQTEAATLEDAVEQGAVEVSQVLSPQNVRQRMFAPGVVPQDLGSFDVQIKDVVLYDHDGNLQTKNDQVRANGSITLKPGFDFRMVIKNRRIEQLRFINTTTETANLTIEASAGASLKQEVELAHYPFTPIIVFVGFMPIVIVPELSVYVGVDGSVHAGIATGVTQQAQLQAGVRYENSAWQPASKFTNNVQNDLSTLTPSIGLDAKAYTGAQLALLLYGVVGPHVELNVYVRLHADPLAVPWWTLYGGLEVPLAIEVQIFSRVIASYQATLIEHEIVLASAPSSATTRVSIATNGTQGNNLSDTPRISGDGRYVVFESFANNLVSGDTNNIDDIFVRDRQTGQTSRVSVATNGTQGNSSVDRPAISSDGRYIVFRSRASNLVSGDTNGIDDIFVHDRQTAQTSRVSVATNGAEGNGSVDDPAISGDGRYVAFESGSSTLVSGDTNSSVDIFVHDQQTGQTSLVSVATNGAQGNGGSYWSSISGDGRYVAFVSDASNLVSGDTNGTRDIFTHDRQTGQTSRVSVATSGTQGNALSFRTAISGDGRYVAFESDASNLVSGDTNGFGDVFVHDRQTGQTSQVSVATNGTQGNALSDRPSLSADGRYVTFESGASNLVSGDTNGFGDVFVYDRQTGQTSLVSVATDKTQGNNRSYWSTISIDGRYVAFASSASNLVSGDTNGSGDIFVHDRGS
jgi:WD40-like Beta Propeller Repeat